MSNHDQYLADLIDQCMEDILLGTATIEECLERAPEHRDELEPLLRAGLEMTTVPVATPAPDPTRRAVFMAELRATPQEAPRFRLPLLPSFGSLGSFSALLRITAVAAPAAVIAVIAIALVWSGGGSTASAATLTIFVGQVEEQVDGNWQTIEDGATLQEGVTLRTTAASFAMLTFPDGSTATVDASTQLSLEQIAVNGGRQISLHQMSGRIWNDVVPIRQGDSYVIRTPHAVVEAHGTVFETVVNGDTAVVTAEGLVSLERGERTVEVVAGQTVRTNAEGIGALERSPLAGTIEIFGPVVAYLASPEGAATGVLLNGVTFRQIPGVITSDVEMQDGVLVQTLSVGDAQGGEYSLVLRRYGPGPAGVTVVTGASSLDIDVPESVAIARLPMEVGLATSDAVVLRALSNELESVGELPQVRVVETDRSRSASNLDGPRPTASPNASASVAVPRTPTAEATRAQQGTPASTGTARPPATTATTAIPTAPPVATAPVATVRPTRTPEAATPLATATSDAWVGRLQAALATGSDRRVELVLDELLEGDDATKAARLATLAAAMSDPATADRIREQVDDDELREINREAARLVPALADTLRSALDDSESSSSGDGRNPGRGNSGSDPPLSTDANGSPDDRDNDRRSVPDRLRDLLDDLRERRGNTTPATPVPAATAPASATEPAPAVSTPAPAATVVPTEAPTVPWIPPGLRGR